VKYCTYIATFPGSTTFDIQQQKHGDVAQCCGGNSRPLNVLVTRTGTSENYAHKWMTTPCNCWCIFLTARTIYTYWNIWRGVGVTRCSQNLSEIINNFMPLISPVPYSCVV